MKKRRKQSLKPLLVVRSAKFANRACQPHSRHRVGRLSPAYSRFADIAARQLDCPEPGEDNSCYPRCLQSIDLYASSMWFMQHPGCFQEETMNRFRQMLWTNQQGQDIAEYAVMLAVILVIVVGTIRLVGSNANNVFSSVASSVK